MDIVAHGLWAAAAVELARRRVPVSSTVARAAVALAVVPDLLHALPLLPWAVAKGHDGFAALSAYAVALPGQEPPVPDWVTFASHHLHCIAHSAVIAGIVTLLCAMAARSVLPALLGWWSHIVIDVFTHSADFYPVPVLYPFSELSFDGIAWNLPWSLVANYALLGALWGWLVRSRRSDAAAGASRR
jgi:membrane-bound metal-dependent hydrolase YbcI (DUF457 family)